ncbi:MAG TPA: TonB-dependent receptor [Caulobacteraceae bacterium]|jgi:outer membrane receptor protein involved in Fe transport
MKPATRFTIAALSGSTAIFLALQASAAASADSNAAADGPASVSEIVVTASKRESTVQTTPISISAVSGADLQARGIASFADLAQGTPGVSLKSEGPSQTEVEMRGMTSSGGNTATVGFYLDDVPLSGPANAQNGHVVIDPDLYDLNRIEMLRGPQGTLFGAGSMGGTVRLITNQPDPTGYHASAETILSGTDGGSFNHAENFMVNMPLVQDKLALRIVGTENYTSGWINRITAFPFPATGPGGTVRGNVQDAPIESQDPGSNAYQLYGARVSLLWQPTPNLTITPAFFYETSKQNGPSAYDSVSATNSAPGGGLAHYQPFNIAEPLTDEIRVYSLNVNYHFKWFDLTSTTAYWSRLSTQTEEASEAFNNPNTGVTLFANFGAPFNPGYYGPTGSGPESGFESDPSSQLSQELRLTSNGGGKLTWVAGLYYSHFDSLWTFAGTTPNFSSYMDLGSLQPATTPNWFDAHEPTRLTQTAAYADASYAFTSALKLEVGARVNYSDYHFSSCISGWGSALGAATPSCTGPVSQYNTSFNPKFTLSYTFSPDLMAYGTVASGFRPGGANALYPTTGAVWGAAFAAMHYTGNKWPSTYGSDSVWSYEAGEKARLFDRRLTVNASVYYEHWSNIQLEAYPDDWALNINGKFADVEGAEVDIFAILGAGFNLEVSGGYVHEYLDGGPHWVITPIHTLPDVAPESGTATLSYSRPLSDDFTFTARLENTYTGRRYSLAFPVPFNSFGAYIPVSAYDLTNIRAGVKFRDTWSVTAFVDNVFNKHAQLESLYMENLASTAFNRIVTNQPLTAGVDLSYRF